MPTVYLNYKHNTVMQKNKSEYFLKLIIKQTLECLNSNCISYVTNNKNFKIDANVTISPASKEKSLPYIHSGLQIFFTPGNPKSKRLAVIMAENLKNIYYHPSNVTIHPKEKNQININDEPHVCLCLSYENNEKDLVWVKENTEEISQNIIMSLTEYFGLPFCPGIKPLKGIAKFDSDIFSKPNIKSKIIGFIAKNKRTKIAGQWEDWYIIGKNFDLGYIPSKYINVLCYDF